MSKTERSELKKLIADKISEKNKTTSKMYQLAGNELHVLMKKLTGEISEVDAQTELEIISHNRRELKSKIQNFKKQIKDLKIQLRNL